MRRKFWTLLTAIAIILAPKTSSALILKAIEEAYNVIPLSPVINFGEDIAETGKLLNKTAMKVQKLTIQIKKDIINLKIAFTDIKERIQALVAGDFGALTGLFGLSDEKEKVEICGVDMADTNHDGMARKLQEILLTYGIGEKEIVDRNRRKFYLDNVYNIYAAVQVLRYNLSDYGDIGQKITSAQLCCGEGQGRDCGLPVIQGSNNNDDEGLIEMQMYYGYALGALENLIKTWERVAALKAQLQAVETIMDIELKPDFSEDTTDTSWVEPAKSAKIYASAQTSSSQPLVFAQMIYNDSKAFDFEEIINEDDKTTSPGGFTGMGLKFSRPKSTLALSAFAQNKNEMESYRKEITDIENTLSKAISIHGKIRNIDEYQETAKQLKSLQEQYAKKLKILEDSNQCGRDYVARYFLSPDEVWTGMKRKLTSEEINNYDIRKGISGWAIDAYEFAKAAEASIDFNDNNFDKKEFKVKAANYKSANEEEKDSQVTEASGKGVDVSQADEMANELSQADPKSQVNTEDLEEETVNEDDPNLKPGESNLQYIEEEKVSVNEEKYNKGQGISEEKSKATQDENRKATMIAWHIGALASEDLGFNAGPSTDAENPHWGITKNDRKMIWNDAKIFYDQYLELKYKNIKAYLKRYIKADIIELFISVLEGQVKDINQTDYQQELNKLHTAARAALDQVSEAEEAKTKASDRLEQQKEELEEKIKLLSEEVKNLTQEIAGMVFNAEEGAYTSIDEIVSTKIDYLAAEEDVKQKQDLDNLKEDSVIETEIGEKKRSNIAYNTDDKGQTKTQKEGLLRQKQVALEAARKELDDVNQKIAAAILDKQEQLASSQNTEEISKIIHNLISLDYRAYEQKAENNLSLIIEKVLPNENKNKIKRQITNAAEDIIINLNNQIDRVVDDGLVEIHQLDDDLYLPESSKQVEKIHKEIITKLKGIAIVGEAVGYSLPSGITLASLITMKTDPDTGFFVGAIPAERDFKSPRPMEDFSQPPVREVFHFDMTDFANIKPYDDERYKKYISKVFRMKDDKKLAARAITRGDFLNYGGKVPDLWKMMLQRKAFIETEFKLKDALNQGCEDVALLRGGIMPCRVVGKNKTVVLDVYASKDKQKYTYDHQTDIKYITRTDLQAENLPKCILIDMDENDNIKLTYYNIDARIYPQKEKEKPPFSSEECKASELGMILDADEKNNIYFKAALYELYNDNFRAQNDKKPDKNDNRNLAISEQAQLSRNQIGDFLRQAESEKKMKQSLEEMENKKKNQMAELKELFEDKNNEIWAENAPRPKFDSTWDLTDNTIIDQIKAKLRIAKETILAQVKQLISDYGQNSEDSEKNTAESSESSDKDNERAELIKNRLDELQKLVEFLEIKSNDSETKKDKKTGQNVTYYKYKNIKGKGKYQYPSEYINVTMNLINEDDWQNKANAEINEAIADESARETYDDKSKEKRDNYEGGNSQYRDLEEAYCANY